MEDTDDYEEFEGPFPVEMREQGRVLDRAEPSSRATVVIGETRIALRFATGWDVGKVVPPNKSWKKPKAGTPAPTEFWTKYPSENILYAHELIDSQYGCDNTWIIVEKAEANNKSKNGKQKKGRTPSVSSRDEGGPAPPVAGSSCIGCANKSSEWEAKNTGPHVFISYIRRYGLLVNCRRVCGSQWHV